MLYYKFQIKGQDDERIRKKLQPSYNALESISEMEQNESITKSMYYSIHYCNLYYYE